MKYYILMIIVTLSISALYCLHFVGTYQQKLKEKVDSKKVQVFFYTKGERVAELKINDFTLNHMDGYYNDQCGNRFFADSIVIKSIK